MLYKVKSDYITLNTLNNYNDLKGNIKIYNLFK
jgi:hypothetical protein